jgi:hypothetical protein
MVDTIGRRRDVYLRRSNDVYPLWLETTELGSESRLGKEERAGDCCCELRRSGHLVEITRSDHDDVVGAHKGFSGKGQRIGSERPCIHGSAVISGEADARTGGLIVAGGWLLGSGEVGGLTKDG